jgi:diguanylate cyclase (GGDEF)-like protein
MIKRSARFHRAFRWFVFTLALAAIAFSVFSYLSVKTNINVITGGISAVKSALSGTLADEIARMQQGLTRIYWIVVTEIAILLAGIITSLFAVFYLLDIYFAAMRSSWIDELTGIYNRRASYKILDQEIKRAERFKHPLSIVMMDIDFFKVYNDNNGHVAGDVLLQKISKIIASKIRDVDTLGRYGGEEFLLVLPETPHDSAAAVCERIRKGIESAHFKGEENQPKKQVTVSLGLVTFHGEYGARTHLINSADELLYKAKEKGRNQLIKAYYKNQKT